MTEIYRHSSRITEDWDKAVIVVNVLVQQPPVTPVWARPPFFAPVQSAARTVVSHRDGTLNSHSARPSASLNRLHTSISCRRWTRAMRCFTAASCCRIVTRRKLATVVRGTELIVLATLVRRPTRQFIMQRVLRDAVSCPWVHFVWPDPTQPSSWLTQPNPLHVEKFGPDPTQTNTINKFNCVVQKNYPTAL